VNRESAPCVAKRKTEAHNMVLRNKDLGRREAGQMITNIGAKIGLTRILGCRNKKQFVGNRNIYNYIPADQKSFNS
jgi:hypothetical protein